MAAKGMEAAGMEAAGMPGARRVYSDNVIEPRTRQLFEAKGQAADSAIARMRTEALALVGVTVGPEAHSWRMIGGKLEFVTILP